MSSNINSLSDEFRNSWITSGFVGEETAHLVVQLAPEERANLVGGVVELCQPLEDLTEGEANRLRMLQNLLGRESLTDTVVETVLVTKPAERHKKTGLQASTTILRSAKNK